MTNKDLTKAVSSLREIRFQLHPKTAPSILAEFDVALAILEESLQELNTDEPAPSDATERLLTLVGKLLEIAGLVSSLINQLGN